MNYFQDLKTHFTFFCSVGTMATAPVSERSDSDLHAFKRPFSEFRIGFKNNSAATTICGSVKEAGTRAQSATSSNEFTFEQRCAFVHHFLRDNGFVPDYISVTGDGSYLLEYLTRTHACVDVYPSGEVILLIRSDGVDSVYDMRITEMHEIADLLENAGVSVRA